jgi:hypothetical protein
MIPIYHSPVWPAIPAKLPSDIPKFDGKSGEDPNNHVMTFHLWCSSNSLMDDSIRLRLFQRTLTGSAAKWYIELPRASFHDFNSLAMSFLTHFQLPIRYETGTELLTSLRQTTSIHISDHIHEWRRRRRLIKAVIPDQLLVEWFTKSLLPQIARDVAMGGVVTEEEAIARAQYLDLVYSQSGTLYELIRTLPVPLMIHPNHRLLPTWMELLAPSKPNLLPSLLERFSGPLRRLLPARLHPLLPPLKLRSLM